MMFQKKNWGLISEFNEVSIHYKDKKIKKENTFF